MTAARAPRGNPHRRQHPDVEVGDVGVVTTRMWMRPGVGTASAPIVPWPPSPPARPPRRAVRPRPRRTAPRHQPPAWRPTLGTARTRGACLPRWAWAREKKYDVPASYRVAPRRPVLNPHRTVAPIRPMNPDRHAIYADLPNKPLVEAVFEVRWAVPRPGYELPSPMTMPPQPGMVDEHYETLVGLLYSALKEEYPHSHRQPVASFPVEMMPFMARHWFRAAQDGWPLVQVGPGMVSLSSTNEYHWDEFSARAQRLVRILCEEHPAHEEIVPLAVTLRYINAAPFDPTTEDLLQFLSGKLNVGISLPKGLVEPGPSDVGAQSVAINLTHKTLSPPGQMNLQIATGEHHGEKVVTWNTQVVSVSDDVPELPGDLDSWLERAYDLSHRWFFALIEGDLLREYKGQNG